MRLSSDFQPGCQSGLSYFREGERNMKTILSLGMGLMLGGLNGSMELHLGDDLSLWSRRD